ncbi:MAG: hypothetical protein MUC94_06610 [bacterium]|nr:hypothetical protein [bacterium]
MFLIVLTGLIWCANGIIFSYAARRSLDFVSIMVIATFLGSALCWIFLSEPHMILNGTAVRFGDLAVTMISSGILGTVGVILMQRAMRRGHHGIVWTISQFALIVPFLFGVIVFHEPTTLLKNLGLFFVLASFLAFGLGQSQSQRQQDKSFRFWFPMTLVAFFILGIHQSITLIPGYWKNWDDVANLRGSLINTGFFISYLIAIIFSARLPNRAEIKLGLVSGIFVFISPITLFGSMDLLKKANLLSMVYPLAVGICIIAFIIYSALFLKEKSSFSTLAGIVAGIAGLMLISF